MTAEFSDAVLDEVHGRSGWLCEMCGKSRADEHHHRRPRGSGGTNRASSASAANCLHACRNCHRAAESNRDLATTCGWLVEQNADPALTPVIYRGERVLLDELGNLEAVA